MNEVILKADHIYKEFGATKAVTDVSVELCAGEVMGLIGENGSGKSTLSNMIGGVFPPTQGKLFLHGQPYAPTSPLDAKRHGRRERFPRRGGQAVQARLCEHEEDRRADKTNSRRKRPARSRSAGNGV